MNDNKKSGFSLKNLFSRTKRILKNRKQRRKIEKGYKGSVHAKQRIYLWTKNKDGQVLTSRRKHKHFGTFSPRKKVRGIEA